MRNDARNRSLRWLFLASLPLLLAACRSLPPPAPERPSEGPVAEIAEPRVVGSWRSVEVEQDSAAPDPLPAEMVAALRIDFTFRPDGTFESRSYLAQGGEELASELVEGTYEVTDALIVTRTGRTSETHPYRFSLGRLILEDAEDGLRIVLRRRGEG